MILQPRCQGAGNDCRGQHQGKCDLITGVIRMECQARFRQKKIVQRNTGNRAQHTAGVTAGTQCGEQHPQHIEHNNVIARKVQLQEKEADERDAAQDACGDQKITDRRQKRTGEQLPS